MGRIFCVVYIVMFISFCTSGQDLLRVDSILEVYDNLENEKNVEVLKALNKGLDINLNLSSDIIDNDYLNTVAEIYETAGHYHYYNSNLDKATNYLQRSLNIGKRLNDSLRITTSLNKMVHVQIDLGNFQKAHDINNEAFYLSNLIFNKKLIAETYRNAGLIYFYQNNYKAALEKYLISVDTYESTGEKSDIGFVYNAIGVIYNRWNFPEKAISYFQKAETIFRYDTNHRRLSQVLNNLADVYSLSLKDYDKALIVLFESLKLREQLNEKIGIALLYNNIGTVYGNMGEYQNAYIYLLKSKAKYDELKNDAGKVMVDFNIGSYYFEQGRYDSAINYFKVSLNVAKSIGYNDYIASNYKTLTECYAAKCDFENFSKYYHLDKHISDSLISLLNKTEMLEVEAKHRFNIISQENTLLKNQTEKQKKTIIRNRYLMISLGLVVGFLLFYLLIIKLKQKQ